MQIIWYELKDYIFITDFLPFAVLFKGTGMMVKLCTQRVPNCNAAKWWEDTHFDLAKDINLTKTHCINNRPILQEKQNHYLVTTSSSWHYFYFSCHSWPVLKKWLLRNLCYCKSHAQQTRGWFLYYQVHIHRYSVLECGGGGLTFRGKSPDV